VEKSVSVSYVSVFSNGPGLAPGREDDRYSPLSVAGLEVDKWPRVGEVGYDQVGCLDLRDDSCVDVVVVLYAIDALCIDSERGESLSQDLENGIGVLLTKRHRDEAAQLCGHETYREDRFPKEDRQLALGGPRLFSTSASVIIIGSTGHS
jgi:hypothetical protein